MKPICYLTGLLVALGTAGPATWSAEMQKLLRVRFQPGQVFDVTIVQETNVEFDAQGQPGEMKQEFTWYARQAVKEVAADGTATVEQQFRRIHVRMTGNPQVAAEYDTGKPENRPTGIVQLIAPALDALTKHPFTVKISATGKIVDLQLPSDLTQALSGISDLPGLSEMFSKEGLAQLLRHSLFSLPEKEVSKGETWQDSYEISNPLFGKQRITSTYSYDGEQVVNGRKVDRVLVKIDMSSADEAASTARVKIQEQDTQGELQLDPSTGILIKGEIQHRMVMRINDMFTQTAKGPTKITVTPALTDRDSEKN